MPSVMDCLSLNHEPKETFHPLNLDLAVSQQQVTNEPIMNPAFRVTPHQASQGKTMATVHKEWPSYQRQGLDCSLH